MNYSTCRQVFKGITGQSRDRVGKAGIVTDHENLLEFIRK